jgi:hypothetical protein
MQHQQLATIGDDEIFLAAAFLPVRQLWVRDDLRSVRAAAIFVVTVPAAVRRVELSALMVQCAEPVLAPDEASCVRRSYREAGLAANSPRPSSGTAS